MPTPAPTSGSDSGCNWAEVTSTARGVFGGAIMAIQATRIDSKGRVVLPKETRKKLGLEPGDFLFVDTDGERHIIYMAKPDNPLDVLAILALEEDRAGLTVDLDDALAMLDDIEPDADDE